MAEKIIFAGAYGIRSQGDDAALLVLHERLKDRYPDMKGAVICRHREQNLYKPYKLRSLPNLEYASKQEGEGKWFRGFNYDDDRKHLYRLQREIASADLLVLGAGNAFADYTIDLLKGPIPYFTILTLMARMTDTPIMWFGISIGPLSTELGGNMTRLASQLADIVTVRDETSKNRLRQLGYRSTIYHLPDPVLGLSPVHECHHPVHASCHRKGKPVIAVSVRGVTDTMGMPLKKYTKRMASILDYLVETHHASLLFIPHCTYELGTPDQDDRNIAREIVARMARPQAAHEITDHLSVRDTLALYHGCSMALCTRLHANVYAAIQGVPTVAISYNPKVYNFMESVDCEKYCIDLCDLNIDIVAAKTTELLLEADNIVTGLRKKIHQKRQEIDRYVELAQRLINKKKPQPSVCCNI
ncbi:polysaccharide pyruvyl transferase family protein [Desulfolithobacter sp.]